MSNSCEELARYLNRDPQPVRGVIGIDPSTRRGFRLVEHDDIPDEVSLIAGDAATNLRGAIDHVGAALVRRAGKTPGPGSEFPIEDGANGQPKRSVTIAQATLPGKRDDVSQFVDAVQPYHEPHSPNHPLIVIRELSNRHKHRTLLDGSAGIGGATTDVYSLGRYGILRLARHRVGDDYMDLVLEAIDGTACGETTFHVLVEHGDECLVPVVQAMVAASAFVRTRILEPIEKALFSPS